MSLEEMTSQMVSGNRCQRQFKTDTVFLVSMSITLTDLFPDHPSKPIPGNERRAPLFLLALTPFP